MPGPVLRFSENAGPSGSPRSSRAYSTNSRPRTGQASAGWESAAASSAELRARQTGLRDGLHVDVAVRRVEVGERAGALHPRAGQPRAEQLLQPARQLGEVVLDGW